MPLRTRAADARCDRSGAPQIVFANTRYGGQGDGRGNLVPSLRFLIDENLSVALVELAQSAGYETHHVARYGLESAKDWDLLKVIRERDLVLVTNNVAEFRDRYAKEALHAGIVLIVPNVPRSGQLELWRAALDAIALDSDLVNTALEIAYEDDSSSPRHITLTRYTWPSEG